MRVFSLSVVLAAFFLSLVSHAEPRALSLSDYFAAPVNPGDVVCEAVQNTCYLTLKFEQSLSQNDDSSGALMPGAISPGQSQFTRVTVKNLIAELGRGRIKNSPPVDLYVQVEWQAHIKGPIGKDIGDANFVHARLTQNESGDLRVEVLDVPEVLFSSLELGEAFGRNISSENEQLNRDYRAWLEEVLNAVVPSAFVTKIQNQP